MCPSTLIGPVTSRETGPVNASFNPTNLPGVVDPIPTLPIPVTTKVPIPDLWIMNSSVGSLKPIPIDPSLVTIKADLNGSNGSTGSNVAPPTPTWNLPEGWVVPTPTRPPVCPSPSLPLVVDIATKTVPPRPTFNLWVTSRYSIWSLPPT